MDSLQQQLLPHLRGELGERLRNTILFYPHCHRDLHYPVTLFAPWVPDIWFADLIFFRAREPADVALPALRSPGYQLLDVTIVGPPVSAPVWGDRDPLGRPPGDIEPCIRTETYRRRQSGRAFRVHRRRGYSVSGFRSLIDQPLGVFFYRGDSREGSNVPWLTILPSGRAFFGEVLDRLVDGGLLVTDGSRMENRRTTRHYRNIRDCRPVEFSDREGRRFVPLTNGDNDRDRRLVVWQVFKPTVAAAEE